MDAENKFVKLVGILSTLNSWGQWCLLLERREFSKLLVIRTRDSWYWNFRALFPRPDLKQHPPKRHMLCRKCWGDAKIFETYDMYACLACNEWLEDPCRSGGWFPGLSGNGGPVYMTSDSFQRTILSGDLVKT